MTVLTSLIIVGIPVIFLTYLPLNWLWARTAYCCLTGWASKLLLLAMLVPINYKGMEHIPATTQQVIFVANHESSIDIFLMNGLVGCRPQAWLAWHVFAKYPVLDHLMAYSCIPVYFDEKTPATSAVRSAVERVHAGYSIVMFPEGGRYPDRLIHDFYTGFAAIAKLTNLPVIPIYIDGVSTVFPRGSRLIKSGEISVDVGEPFTINKDETVAQFKDRVHEWFVEQNEIKRKA